MDRCESAGQDAGGDPGRAVEVFNSFTDDELGRLSKHLSGEAFDLQPMTSGPKAKAVKATIRGLAGL